MARLRSRFGTIVVLVLVLAHARDAATEPADLLGSIENPNRPIAIKVRDGRASFVLPTVRADSQTLVIVSALSRGRGPFPIELRATASGETKPIDREGFASTGRRAPELPKPWPGTAPTDERPPDRRIFHLLALAGDVARASSYESVEGELQAVGRRVQVYVDLHDLPRVSAETLRDVVATFDDAIYPLAESRFGTAEDVDGDGRFTVLFSGRLDRLAGGKASVDGFVRGADLDPTINAPFGNRCDMMFLNANLRSGPYLRSILAHEYTHAVTFSRKALAKGGSGLEEEGWLDEGLSHLVEDLHGFSRSNIDYRVSAFLSQPERYRLVVEDYYASDLFRSHGNRGSSYLFLRWCVDQYGSGLLDTLIRSDRRGIANVEAATGCKFADLFRRWSVSLYLSGLDPSASIEDGYRSIDLRGTMQGWTLAGPRVTTIQPGRATDSWFAEGTTAHYAIIDGSPSGAVSIEVEAPPEAEIQVTAVGLPGGLGRPSMRVQRSIGSSGGSGVVAEIAARDDKPVRLESIAWEPLVPSENPKRDGFRSGRLDRPGIASRSGGGNSFPRSIALPDVSPIDGPFVFKAVGTDDMGRRVVAWSLLPSARDLRPIASTR